jgi:hypothetical protein
MLCQGNSLILNFSQVFRAVRQQDKHADGRDDSVRTANFVRYVDIHRDSPDIQMPETGIAHFYKIMVLQLERCNAR